MKVYSPNRRAAVSGLAVCILAAGALFRSSIQPHKRGEVIQAGSVTVLDPLSVGPGMFEAKPINRKESIDQSDRAARLTGGGPRGFPNAGIHSSDIDLVTGIMRY